jgi:hypothetical protein
MADETQNASDRLSEFEAEVAGLKTGGGSANPERKGMMLGLVLMAAGVIIPLVSFFSSRSAEDPRAQRDLVILALFGIALTLCGVALFAVNALTRWFRYWLVRLIFEHRSQTDRIIAED